MVQAQDRKDTLICGHASTAMLDGWSWKTGAVTVEFRLVVEGLAADVEQCRPLGLVVALSFQGALQPSGPRHLVACVQACGRFRGPDGKDVRHGRQLGNATSRTGDPLPQVAAGLGWEAGPPSDHLRGPARLRAGVATGATK